ncbi:energy-coupling factor ABC transporter ATP-binding protein [Vibrio sp. ZSDZ65]|uniref:Energy-coupling factor ABC transporter ATP-binding protein n=1 Tax=Vibrio qingdaonensis TaxID=2829491 RepID=A0A9X3CS77_9VIBR|nr:energy-coupling factor ABC transporter ATP-binding protein [Vibrio qingdaonensis]MCW8348511.1 energy-coupling factor ABC transporter ATP-binding protein [Vibrio qingdaonensis]
MTIQLKAKQISMRFNTRVLFHIPELSIGPNDAVYLKGANGVGKTTLLKILAGLLKPSSGVITPKQGGFFNRLCSGAGRKDVIYLHQSAYLFDGTVYQNVVYGLKHRRQNAHDKRADVIAALRLVGLETLADEHVSVLSGGEKQRVAMARAWVLKPSILLMDEPSASLDQESIERLVTMAQDLLDLGSSIVVTSHQANRLTALCRKQWWIKDCTLIESPLLQVIDKSSVNKSAIKHANINQESTYAATSAD